MFYFYFLSAAYNAPIVPLCVHPRSLARMVVYPSTPHHSTGSTVATFLTQDDLGSIDVYLGPRVNDIPEEDASDTSSEDSNG